MMMRPYPAYKDSGVEWLGQIPEGWTSWKISHAFGSVGSGTTPPSNEQEWYENGNIPWITTGELRENVIIETVKLITESAFNKFSTLKLYPAGSLAIAMYGATIGRLGILGVEATTNQACCVLSNPICLNLKFTFYWFIAFKQRIIDLYATGGGQPNINQETITSLRIPAPCLENQVNIATFLDHEISKLDTLIAKQEHLIELLQEKRQAIISHAVSKGLNHDTKMKDSGINWLGKIPESWGTARIKWFTKIYSGGTPDKSNEFYWTDGTIPWLNSGSVNDGLISEPSNYITEEAFEKSSAKWIPKNALVIALAGQGRTKGMVAQLAIDTTCNQSMAAIIPTSEISSRFLFWWLKANYQNIRNLAGGDLRDGLNLEMIGGIYTPIPSHNEQKSITENLDKETFKIDCLVNKARRSIELAKEHRTALISAAVTGKIDVREAA